MKASRDTDPMTDNSWAACSAELQAAFAAACDQLGYIDTALASAMAYVLWANWSSWPSAASKPFREIGRELDHAEKVARCMLPQTRCTAQAYAGLTAKGREVGPSHAYRRTFRKAADLWEGKWRFAPPPPPELRQPQPEDGIDIVRTTEVVKAKLTPDIGEAVWFETEPPAHLRRLGPNRVRLWRPAKAVVVLTLERGKVVRRRPAPHER